VHPPSEEGLVTLLQGLQAMAAAGGNTCSPPSFKPQPIQLAMQLKQATNGDIAGNRTANIAFQGEDAERLKHAAENVQDAYVRWAMCKRAMELESSSDASSVQSFDCYSTQRHPEMQADYFEQQLAEQLAEQRQLADQRHSHLQAHSSWAQNLSELQATVATELLRAQNLSTPGNVSMAATRLLNRAGGAAPASPSSPPLPLSLLTAQPKQWQTPQPSSTVEHELGKVESPAAGDMLDECYKMQRTLGDQLHDLEKIDKNCIVLARRIGRLGFASPQILEAHFSQHGKVCHVLVPHSFSRKSGPPGCVRNRRLRPAAMGFIVMSNEQDVQSILAAGTEQKVRKEDITVTIQVLPFKHRSELNNELHEFRNANDI
jgi:hypothetical protein